jgi:hypothetical protein
MNRFSPSLTDTLENPVKHGHMITCWQNGRRVLMHSSEVAKKMKREVPKSTSSCPASQVGSSRLGQSSSPMSGKPDIGCRASTPLNAATPKGVDARDKREHDEEKRTGASLKPSFDLTPSPIRPRSRSLAQNEGWQQLAKEMARVAKHPPRCHKRHCRRTKKCEGGKDASYFREFDAFDVVMQQHVLPAIRRA